MHKIFNRFSFEFEIEIETSFFLFSPFYIFRRKHNLFLTYAKNEIEKLWLKKKDTDVEEIERKTKKKKCKKGSNIKKV